MKRLLLTCLFGFIVTGCTSMADVTSRVAGVGTISEEKWVFDNTTVVTMSPAFLYAEGEWLGVDVKLGARWSSNSSDHVALIMSYRSSKSGSGSDMYTNFSGLDVNIDGTIMSYKTGGFTSHADSGYNTVPKTSYNENKNSVILPLNVLKDMLAAEDCRLRIHTCEGYVDAQFSIERIPGGGGQGTAILSMREFVAKVESNRGASQ
ncbi:MAG: hypothetical protein JRF37_01570 [Deltaproteobacteria bacterium]|nr:hypothetical protein [Deltaproteobacteria bacterium]